MTTLDRRGDMSPFLGGRSAAEDRRQVERDALAPRHPLCSKSALLHKPSDLGASFQIHPTGDRRIHHSAENGAGRSVD